MSEQRAVYITDEWSGLTPDQWEWARDRLPANQRTVVKVVPLPMTQWVEMLSCGHAGRLLPFETEHPAQDIGETRECLTCKWSKEADRG